MSERRENEREAGAARPPVEQERAAVERRAQMVISRVTSLEQIVKEAGEPRRDRPSS